MKDQFILIRSDHYEPGYMIVGVFDDENQTKEVVKHITTHSDFWGHPVFETVNLRTLEKNIIYQVK